MKHSLNNRNLNVTTKLMRGLAYCLVLLLISACTDSTSDLQIWAQEVKSKPQKGVEPLPEVIPYKAFAYNATGKRDPFDSSIFRPKIGINPQNSSNSGISPDRNRVPEYLESFPLDTLRMVGTIAQEENTWALIQTPDKTIQRVLSGNYLGQNNGKIVSVNSDEVTLVEIVPDGFGGWEERDATIALTEQ
ncbi:MAG: pilus assembly protein PilP [Pseudomonadota bacterium]